MLGELKELGFDEKKIKILLALREGPQSGPEIERITGLRQPEVSRALHELRSEGLVRMLKSEKRFKRGAPMKIWSLSKDFDEIVKQIVGQKLAELDKKLKIAVSILFEVAKDQELDPEIVKEILNLKNDDEVVFIELKKNGDGE